MSQFQNDSPHKIPKPSSEVNTPHLSSFHSDDDTNPNLAPDSPHEGINPINLHEVLRTAQEKNEIRTSENPPVDHQDKEEAKAAETLYTEENHQSEVQPAEQGSVRHLLKEGRQTQNNDEEGKPLKKDAAVIQMPPATESVKRNSSIRNNTPQKHQHRRFPAVLLCGFLSFYYLSVLGLLLYLLVVHMTDKRYNLQATAGALDYMGMNLENHPIIGISVAAQGSRCSGNFESVRLSTWPSSREGCYKLDNDVLVPALCDGMDLEEHYFSIYKQNLYSWKGYQFCIQRAVRNKDYVLAATCPAGYNKQCSPGICMKSTVECPITSVSITTGALSGESIAYGASNYLNIERQQGEQPLVNITASVGGLPCFSTTNQPAVAEPYVAINDQPEGCLMYGIDQESFQIDTDTQLNFLESNKVKSDIMDLPGYKAGVSKINVVLAGRKRIEVEPTKLCLNANTNKMQNPGEDSSRLRFAVSALTSISLICHFLVGMTLMNLMCGRLWVKISLRDLIWEKKNLYKILLVGFIFLEVFALSLLTVFVNMYKDGIRTSESYFQDLIGMNCFGTDSQASSILANYNEYVNNNVSSLLIYVFLCCGISLVFMGIIIFTLCYMAKLYQKSHRDLILPRLYRVQSSH